MLNIVGKGGGRAALVLVLFLVPALVLVLVLALAPALDHTATLFSSSPFSPRLSSEDDDLTV